MKKMSKVAIIGFPNVGKSTLFNRLLKKKKSLVHSLPGMTRDMVTATCRLDGNSFLLIDTGGFFDSAEDIFSPLVRKKAWEASESADILLFILDGKREFLPAEEELYFSLKRLDKPIIVIVNKLDSPHEEIKLADYFRLGEEDIIPISAEHKRNLKTLEKKILDNLPSAAAEKEDIEALKIALVGRINVGKSSLVNRLCGQDKLIVSEIPGTTRDSTDTLIYRDKKAFCLVDTAGIRKLSRTKDKREQASILKAKKDIKRADVVCLILDAQEFPTRQDTAIGHLAKESGKPLILALNKWDLISEEVKNSDIFKQKSFHKLDFISYAPIIYISALSGKRVVKILDLAEVIHAKGSKKLPTNQLNKFLVWVNENHPPLSRKKRKMRIKYMTQAGVLPPTFILFTHSKASLSPSYEKHFIHMLRERFDFSGSPVRLVLKRN